MEKDEKSVLRRNYIRDKHSLIYRQFIDLMKQEHDENPVRAEHIGKLYYVRVIAQNMTPPMAPAYILKVINKQSRNSDFRG